MNILFFLFCFLNLYGPLSTNITLALNIIMFLFVGRSRIVQERFFILIPVLLLLLSIASFYFSRDSSKDYSFIGTYIRLFISCAVFPAIIAYFYSKKIRIMDVLSWTLVLHCVMVLVQMIEPSFQELNSLLFRYERDQEILANLSLRRLGLTGGYDQSAIYTVISTILSLSLYFRTSKIKYGVFTIISLFASLFTSRTGMVGAVLSLIIYMLLNRSSQKKSIKVYSVLAFSVAILTTFYFVLPVVLNSMNISYGHEVSDANLQYGSRTGEILTGIQMTPLESLNTREWIMGYGCDVRKVSWLLYSSDIGYVKQVYQVGLFGIFLILIFSFKMSIKTLRRYKNAHNNTMMKTGNQLMWGLLWVYCIFNFKNHSLYSVCSYEVFLLIYCYFYCYYYESLSHKSKLKLSIR